MNRKLIFKISVDFIMILLLLALMGYPITDEKIHEWLGISMLLMFIIHNILNIQWYKNLFKGKYTVFRICQTMLNVIMTLVLIALMSSGLMMSSYVFGGHVIEGMVALGREMHLPTAYWGFVLMSLHFGLHWGMIMGMSRQMIGIKTPSKIRGAILRILALGIAIFGIRNFIKHDLLSYMLLKTEFAFFDYEQTGISFFIEYLSMMGTCIFVAYYGILKISRKIDSIKK